MTHCFSSQWAENDFAGIKFRFERPDKKPSTTQYQVKLKFKHLYLSDFYTFTLYELANSPALN